MKQVFTVCFLEDDVKDFNQIKSLLSSSLEEAIKENLQLVKPKVNIKHYHGEKKLQDDLLNDSDIKKTLKLFILDYYLNDSELNRDWFERYFPAVPKIFITSAGSQGFKDNVIEKYINKDRLNNKDDFKRDLKDKIKTFFKSPFWEALKDYPVDGNKSWHTPGHSFGNSFARSPFLKDFYDKYTEYSFATDLSVSVDELGDLSEPADKPMDKAMNRAKDVFGSMMTYFVTNGTSTSNKIILTALLKPGDVVLVDRNCHKSVHQSIVMSGALPLYLSPAYNETFGIWLPLSLEQIKRMVCNDEVQKLKPKMLVLTSCTYDGMVYPLNDIVSICDPEGIIILADEAWFAYGRFHPFYGYAGEGNSYVRYNAIDSGAHLSVQSTHKTLSAFSQASMIHIGRRLGECFKYDKHWLKERFTSFEKFEHVLVEGIRYFASTSPHYPMIASLDVATTQCLNEGLNSLEEKLSLAKELKDYVGKETLSKKDIIGDKKGFDNYLKDPLKFTVKVKKMDNFKKILMDKGLRWEKSTYSTILFLITFGSSKANLEDLKMAIKEGKEADCFDSKSIATIRDDFVKGQVEILPMDAHYAEGKYVGLENAKDKIACHMVVPYPPGIPLILPGMRTSDDVIKKIKELITDKNCIHGVLWNGDEAEIRIIDEKEEIKIKEKRQKLKQAFEVLKNLNQNVL